MPLRDAPNAVVAAPVRAWLTCPKPRPAIWVASLRVEAEVSARARAAAGTAMR